MLQLLRAGWRPPRGACGSKETQQGTRNGLVEFLACVRQLQQPKILPHFHSEVQHRPFPLRARSSGAEDGPVMANPDPGAPEIRARGG